MERGEAFALDLKALYPQVHAKLRGKYAVVWSMGAVDVSATHHKRPHSRVVMSDAIFDSPPTLATLRRRSVRVLTLTYWAKPEPATFFIEDAPLPKGVTAIGRLTSLPKVKPYRCYAYWSSFALHRSNQWRHDHDRKALELEAKKDAAKEQAKALAQQKARRAGGLAQMKRRTLVAEWTGLVSAGRCRSVRRMLRESIGEIARVDSMARRRALLQTLVERINAYDDAQGCFIETPEREALMTCLEDIAVVGGLGAMTKQLDQWRDW